MIDMSDVVADADMMAPKPFAIMRSVGQWTQNGFVSTTSQILQVGPVQRATDKEAQALPEADRVGGVMAFWCLVPIYTTRGDQAETSAQGVTPQGVYPGTEYTVDPTLVGGTQPSLYKNGLFQTPGIDYTYTNGVITMLYTTDAIDRLYLMWTDTQAGDAASDIIQYAKEQYRILHVRHYPGSGFWKALGTRLSTI